MPRIGVSITKSFAFRNGTQEFSNVYYYEVLSLPNVSQADTIIDNLTAFEKTLHPSIATFKKGRLWSETGSAATSNMISQKNLSGTGSKTAVGSVDRERALLFRLRAGVDSRGNPVYLRKWYHALQGIDATVSFSSAIIENTSGFSATDRTKLVATVGPIGDANGSPLTPRLCSKVGRLPDAGATWEAHPFLEHHQLGDQWRAG